MIYKYLFRPDTPFLYLGFTGYLVVEIILIGMFSAILLSLLKRLLKRPGKGVANFFVFADDWRFLKRAGIVVGLSWVAVAILSATNAITGNEIAMASRILEIIAIGTTALYQLYLSRRRKV